MPSGFSIAQLGAPPATRRKKTYQIISKKIWNFVTSNTIKCLERYISYGWDEATQSCPNIARPGLYWIILLSTSPQAVLCSLVCFCPSINHPNRFCAVFRTHIHRWWVQSNLIGEATQTNTNRTSSPRWGASFILLHFILTVPAPEVFVKFWRGKREENGK